MTTALFVLIYVCLAVFAAGCVVRAVRYARMPVHLRWELYPVPHEEPALVGHGGSYFEHTDWWTRPRESNRLCELRFMTLEMIFLKGLWEFNRPLWFCSFPFHFGLYLLIGAVALLAAAAVTGLPLHALYTAAGVAGITLAMFGAAALLARRLGDAKMRTYTNGADLFNLAFFLVAFGTLAAGWLTRPAETAGPFAIVSALLGLAPAPPIAPLMGAGLALCALLAAYIPLTHMSHFIAKYFTYHDIRWDDRVNLRGSKLEVRIAEYLAYRPTWSAPHVTAGNGRTWADVATTNPAEKVK